MRTIYSREPDRLDLSAVPVAERAQAIAALAGKPKASKHRARKIGASATPTRCHTCGHIDRTADQGKAMDRHIKQEHGGVGGSSMVL